MRERSIRLFVEPPIVAGASLTLDPARAHYLTRVMRCRSGERIRVFDGVSGEWSAVVEPDKRTTRLLVEARVRPQTAEPGPILAIPPIRRTRLEWAVEKATELGAGAIQLVLCERAGEERSKAERLRALAIEAAEQSERLTVPEVRPLVPLGEWLDNRDAAVPVYIALERSDAPLLPAALVAHGPGDLLVGPEGGFGPSDRALLAGAKNGVAVSLGPTILRAETAAIAGLAGLAMAPPGLGAG
ncbi:MAG: RsmE family RNA methyltransferase [Pseudomonadota bacterium]